MSELKRKIINALDAARMTAPTSAETASRVKQYFGDAGPFSYSAVRKLTPELLRGEISFRVLTAGIEKIEFDLARNQNMQVAELVATCSVFKGKTFYPLKQKLEYSVDKNFAISLRPETVAVVDSIPNLISLQPRKNPTPWAYNPSFLRRLVDEVYEDYFEESRHWLIDTEAQSGCARECRLIDLQSVQPMDDREFIRRMASLRNAWRLYLTFEDTSKRKRPTRRIDDHPTFDF